MIDHLVYQTFMSETWQLYYLSNGGAGTGILYENISNVCSAIQSGYEVHFNH